MNLYGESHFEVGLSTHKVFHGAPLQATDSIRAFEMAPLTGFSVPLRTENNSTKMESTRQNKISRLLQKELADIFQKESRTMFMGKMISVTVVRITSDLSLAKAYISIFPPENNREVLKQIRIANPRIRGILGRRVGKQLRVVPELEFYIDDSLDYMENIDRLLK